MKVNNDSGVIIAESRSPQLDNELNLAFLGLKIDPRKMDNPRHQLGLPTKKEIKNSGQFVIEGRIKNVDGIKAKPADPLDGNPGQEVEYKFSDPDSQIEIERVSGVNPEF